MWVRIKGILYNLSLVKSIYCNHRDNSIELLFTSVILRSDGSYYNDNKYISFDNLEDALLAYKHIIKTIDIPQLKDEDFHNKN